MTKNRRNALFLAVLGVVATRAVAGYRRRQASRPGGAAQRSPEADAVETTTLVQTPSVDRSEPALRVISTRPAQARSPEGGHSIVQPLGLPSHSHLSQVHFGKSGARKDRRKRAMARLGIVALIASLFGLPGVNLGFELLGDRLGRGEDRLTRADLRGVTTSESAEGLMRLRGNMFQSRPTPTPTPTETPSPPAPAVEAEPVAEPVAEPIAAPAGSITEILYAAAAEFGIDGGYLVSVASCESGLNPGAVNPAGYHGLFQFAESTWASYGYGSIYDATAQARTAARMLAAGMAGHWPNCA